MQNIENNDLGIIILLPCITVSKIYKTEQTHIFVLRLCKAITYKSTKTMVICSYSYQFMLEIRTCEGYEHNGYLKTLNQFQIRNLSAFKIITDTAILLLEYCRTQTSLLLFKYFGGKCFSSSLTPFSSSHYLLQALPPTE